MSYPRAMKYRFGIEVQQSAAALIAAYNQFVQLKNLYAHRTWGTGGADAIVDFDLNPNDESVGPNIGITAAQVNALVNYGGNSIVNLFNGVAVATYPIQDAINDVRNDI